MALIPSEAGPQPVNGGLCIVAVENRSVDERTRRIHVGKRRWIKLGGDVQRDGYDGEDEDEGEGDQRHDVRHAAQKREFHRWKRFTEFAPCEGEEVHGKGEEEHDQAVHDADQLEVESSAFLSAPNTNKINYYFSKETHWKVNSEFP